MHDFCIGKDLTATEQVTTDEGYISFIIVHGAGTVTVRNGNETGDVVFKATTVAGASQHFAFPYPIKVRNGIHVTLSGNTATMGYFG